MSTQNQSINLQEKSTIELKALAFDLRSILDNYNQMLTVVTQELQVRANAEKVAQEAPVAQEAEAPAPKTKSKLTKA